MPHDTPYPGGDRPLLPRRARQRPTPDPADTPPPAAAGTPPGDFRPEWDTAWADLHVQLASAVTPDRPDPDPVAVGAALHRVGRALARLDEPPPEPPPSGADDQPRTVGWKLARVADVGGPNFDGPGAPLAAALLRAAVDELPPRLATLTARLLADPVRRGAFAWLGVVGRLLAPWPDAGPGDTPAGGSARDAERLARLLRAPRITRDPVYFPRWPAPDADDPPPASDLIPYPARTRPRTAAPG
ncbi:hypothetical protein [Urbifossiella limnaea]|uniref:Uncharacterized protein n=1 Tax=Urbifossiella limnaea TaxID=2528023 RepID=A0A517Y1E0_9BACT|nr:hypothetical protein [Urbifossiella limnaea]QDU23569.1 hypothetical protein ETAA1_55700 [Urbifossiella limnaea]